MNNILLFSMCMWVLFLCVIVLYRLAHGQDILPELHIYHHHTFGTAKAGVTIESLPQIQISFCNGKVNLWMATNGQRSTAT